MAWILAPTRHSQKVPQLAPVEVLGFDFCSDANLRFASAIHSSITLRMPLSEQSLSAFSNRSISALMSSGLMGRIVRYRTLRITVVISSLEVRHSNVWKAPRHASMFRLAAASVGLMLFGGILCAQDTLVESSRKIVSQAIPVYPSIARNMSLEGTVKLEVSVAPNGAAKSVQAVGGSPVFVRAAEDAVYRFRWIPATEESKEHVEIRFRLK